MEKLRVKALGPIKEANINFGDLTLFVGPQASGKSVLLQLIKLILDKNHTKKTLEKYGYVWGNDAGRILDRFFGEGMSNIWKDNTEIQLGNKSISLENLIIRKGRKSKDENEDESIFFIPAQRVVCLQNGWPRFFTEYEDSVPYVLRNFSETLRQLLENGLFDKKDDIIFPQGQRLKEPLRDSFNKSIFHDGKIVLDKTVKKRFKLNIDNTSIPYMAWSAGQKEFMPLLLSFYYLCPSSKTSRKDEIKYVIIEEPEMGLHPQAIESIILQIIDLLSRNYKVIVSTHSSIFLDFAWAFNYLKKSNIDHQKALFDLFNLRKTPSLTQIFKNIENKKIHTYYFNRQVDGIIIKDISSLDAGSDDEAISEWGGLSTFASKASDMVIKSVNHED